MRAHKVALEFQDHNEYSEPEVCFKEELPLNCESNSLDTKAMNGQSNRQNEMIPTIIDKCLKKNHCFCNFKFRGIKFSFYKQK